jgi:hypothetical protein
LLCSSLFLIVVWELIAFHFKRQAKFYLNFLKLNRFICMKDRPKVTYFTFLIAIWLLEW